MAIICAPWGEEKTCKTTFGLSFPKPLYHFDLDVGGFDRAAWRMNDEDLAFVTTEKFYVPMQVDRMMGQSVENNSGKLSIRFPKKEVGMRELWQKIITKYVELLQDPSVVSIFFDSFTIMWNVCHRAHLQELQEKQIMKNPKISDSELRESLLSKEYGPANDRMRAVISNARAFNKNLIISHYPKDIYGVRTTAQGTEEYRTGEYTLDGFKEVKKLIDIAVRTETKTVRRGDPPRQVKEPVCTITTCGLAGLGIAAEGIQLPTPDYAGIEALVDLMN